MNGLQNDLSSREAVHRDELADQLPKQETLVGRFEAHGLAENLVVSECDALAGLDGAPILSPRFGPFGLVCC